MDGTGFLFIFLAYLVGSISTAILISQLFQLPDPRGVGSNNPGATNILRVGGKKAAALTLLGDSIKGLIPVLLAIYLEQSSLVIGSVAVAVMLGHCFPIFFQFKGGKGVATFFGVIWAIEWPLGLFASLIWLTSTLTFKISSLSALITTALTCGMSYFFFYDYFVFISLISALLIIRHHRNIKNMWAGHETKIGH